MCIVFNEAHLNFFKNNMEIGEWTGPNLLNWTQSVGIPALGESANALSLTRESLKELAANPTVADRDVLWSILAWGRMRRDHARRLYKYEGCWEKVVGRLRRDRLDRRESYRICSEATRTPCGIGPAFFTKLIFFANPKHDGFIMDQWTSRSINLLVEGPRVVRMRTPVHVDPNNNADNFERFCCAVEELSSRLNKEPEYIEQCLFSTGGRNPAPWRRYLKEQGG